MVAISCLMWLACAGLAQQTAVAETVPAIGAPSIAVGRTLSFDVRPDSRVNGVVTHAGDGQLCGTVQRGHLTAPDGGWFVVARCGDAVVGEVASRRLGHYQVRRAAEGRVRMHYVAPHERFTCAGVLHGGPRGAQLVPADPVRGAAGGGPILIDVLIVYTPSSLAFVGGMNGMAALIDSWLAYTEMAYEQSGVSHRLRVVEAAETPYVESGNALTDLARLRALNDGFMDEVHALRDRVGADVVSLINTSGSAGTAYMLDELSLDFASSAFSAIGADTDGIAFAHEIGHNMGCSHNNTAGAPDTVFCYAFGHRTPDLLWRTIMSNAPGEHVDLFSSPELEFGGFPLGVSGAGCPSDASDCVTTFANTAALVAQFRPTAVEVPVASAFGLTILVVSLILAGLVIVRRRVAQG